MIVYESNDNGHRMDYVRYFEQKYGFIHKRRLSTSDVFREKVILIPSSEELILRSFVVCIIRALTYRKTILMILAHKRLVESRSFFNIVKRSLYRFIKHLPRQYILDISGAKPCILANYSLFDLQFEYEPRGAKRELTSSKKMRKLISIGIQSQKKGLDILSELSKVNTDSIYEIYIVGKIIDNSLERINTKSIFVLDRYLTDEEFDVFMDSADILWACYDESYDQPSGIASRACALNKSIIIREKSVMHHILVNQLSYSNVIIYRGDIHELHSSIMLNDTSTNKTKNDVVNYVKIHNSNVIRKVLEV